MLVAYNLRACNNNLHIQFRESKKMLTLQEIKDGLVGLSLTAVTRETGVNRQTLWEIREGKQDNPQLKTIIALSAYLEGRDA